MSVKSRVGVKVKNGNIEHALKVFQSRVYKSGIIQQYMDNQYYTKPSDERTQRKKEKEFKSKQNNIINP